MPILGKYNRAREMGLGLQIDSESRMVDIPADMPRDQLVSILGNLIDNALEATRQQTGEGGRVQLSMTDLGHELIFEVEDQGPGIPRRLATEDFRERRDHQARHRRTWLWPAPGASVPESLGRVHHG